MSDKIYIVVKKYWKYNDEYYTNYNDVFDGVKQTCYTSKEQADKVCKQFNESEKQNYWSDECFLDNSGKDLTRDDVQFYEVIELQLI